MAQGKGRVRRVFWKACKGGKRWQRGRERNESAQPDPEKCQRNQPRLEARAGGKEGAVITGRKEGGLSCGRSCGTSTELKRR